MGPSSFLRCRVIGLAGSTAFAMLCIPAFADEFPKRKAGLWEMKTSGGPIGPQTVQQCIDASTDDLLRTQSAEGRNCTKPTIRRSGNRYSVQSNCDDNGVTSRIEGDYTMSRDTEYAGDMKMSFDPPVSGVSEMNMKMDGRWLGPCKAGMKPGDVVLQGMPKLNVLEMGKGDGSGVTPEKARQMAEELQRNMSKERQGRQAQ